LIKGLEQTCNLSYCNSERVDKKIRANFIDPVVIHDGVGAEKTTRSLITLITCNSERVDKEIKANLKPFLLHWQAGR